MSREVTEQSRAVSAASFLALAVGAAAFGAVAIGVLAIGRLAVGRLVIKKARFNELEVDDLTVHRWRVVEHESTIRDAEDSRDCRKLSRGGIVSPRGWSFDPSQHRRFILKPRRSDAL